MESNLKVIDVARIAECHRNTVLVYERKGIIRSSRTLHGHRRFTESDAQKLKAVLTTRWPGDE
jgi:DNA-binding transcriptional MerR regulator